MMFLSRCNRLYGASFLRSLAKHQQARQLSVKEIAWCTPGRQMNSSNSSEKEELKVELSAEECTSCKTQDSSDCFKFGIIAAMDESRIIGVNRGLPWSLPEDRAHYLNVTRDRVLIIGKNCFFEESDFSHLEHLRHCIVVSTTLEQENLKDMNLKNVHVDIARSFEEALVLGEKVSREYASQEQHGELDIDCWIGGGQLIYEKAIRHPNAYELILTNIHTKLNVDVSSGREIALFPAKYRWDNAFNEVSKREGVDKESGLTYTFCYYRRR
mmetsp:Transcript_6221/g.9426  ORF Transcript_6221/g.9426 Transcript_6221/m.9426 type:complete len:270 (+) Transcript_6221:87-896(+)